MDPFDDGTDKTGLTWRVTTLPCPVCGHRTVIGMLLVNEHGKHMHTLYQCTYWPTGGRGDAARCHWTGYAVPGWDRNEE